MAKRETEREHIDDDLKPEREGLHPEPRRGTAEGPIRPEPLPAPAPTRGKAVTTYDATTQVILEDGNAPPGTGVVTDYAIGAEPPRAFQYCGKYYERARVDEASGLLVYRWNDWR